MPPLSSSSELDPSHSADQDATDPLSPTWSTEPPRNVRAIAERALQILRDVAKVFARMRRSVAALVQDVRARQSLFFPDKRLLQWDCGKLQVLQRLLRQLHAASHRCLIFSQMTKMLNVLEAWICICG